MGETEKNKASEDILQNYRLDGLESLILEIKQHMELQDKKFEEISKVVIQIKSRLYNGMSEAIVKLVDNQNELLIRQAKHEVKIRGLLWTFSLVASAVLATALKVWL